ncbi:hypothetical protein PTKIN_Ptkin14bG0187600 [Pterospermum kingtungense]
MFFPRLALASIIFISSCLTITFTSGATLANDEVEALKIIGRTLGKTDWDFSVDPCSGDKNWNLINDHDAVDANGVACNCTFDNNKTCHVVSILLKAQNLSGTLPPELANLAFLQEIDLTLNYLSGTIPSDWGSLQLVNISLYGNRLTGSIPREWANLSSLTRLVLQQNQFSGNLPPALGNLPKIDAMVLSSNNFTGELPETFANLIAMKQFGISDNNFTGNIPKFIFQNWTKLQEIYFQGSGLRGPIPTIDSLENLTYMILRSCNLIGELPASLGEYTNLKTLDVSFNRLIGEIPPSLSALNVSLNQL